MKKVQANENFLRNNGLIRKYVHLNIRDFSETECNFQKAEHFLEKVSLKIHHILYSNNSESTYDSKSQNQHTTVQIYENPFMFFKD